MIITAIDPGTIESGVVSCADLVSKSFDKIENRILLLSLREMYDVGQNQVVVIESINPYTMGKTTRDTILWSGRFQEACERNGVPVVYISRNDVRQNLCGCGGPKIGDKQIRAALCDRFAYGEKNFGKGTKKAPGFFHGFSKDVWSAFALAVTYYDKYVKQ